MTETKNVFKSLGRSGKEDPRLIIETSTLIPDEKNSPSVGDYIQQLSENGGIHSCLPTSVLNALIHLGSISHEQAQQIQDTFLTTNSNMFARRQIDGRDILTFAFPVGILMEQLTQRELLSKKVKHEIIDTSSLGNSEVEKLLQQQLSKSKLVVAGSSEHAVLIIGYKNKGQTLVVIDPKSPKTAKEENTSNFVTQIQADEHWINTFALEVK